MWPFNRPKKELKDISTKDIIIELERRGANVNRMPYGDSFTLESYGWGGNQSKVVSGPFTWIIWEGYI